MHSAAPNQFAHFLSDALLNALLQAAHYLWPFLLIVIGIYILKWFLNGPATNFTFDLRNFRLINRVRTVKDLIGMAPFQFEHLCRLLFEKQGYKVHVTRPTNDGGVDVAGSRGDERIVAQCKRYTKHSVGRPDLQRFYGTFEDESADHGFFLTTSRFTDQAAKFARNKPITLVDGEELARWINRYASGNLDEAPQPIPDTVVCADCGEDTRLPFTPTKGKPVYCRKCYAKRRYRRAS